MKRHWMLAGVGGIVSIVSLAAAQPLHFQTIIDGVPAEGGQTLTINRVFELSVQAGGHVAAVLDLANDVGDAHPAVVYRAGLGAPVVSVAKVGDSIFKLSPTESGLPLFDDSYQYPNFRDLSLSQSGGVDRLTFLAFPGRVITNGGNGGQGLYQYNASTGGKVRILGEGDAEPLGQYFSFDGGYKNNLASIGYQANSAGQVVFGGVATTGSTPTDVVVAGAAGGLARLADNATPSHDTPALWGFNDASNFAPSKTAVTETGRAVFVANTAGGVAIVEASAPGVFTTRVDHNSSSEHYTPVGLLGATDTSELFAAIVPGAGTQNHAVVLHQHTTSGDTYSALAQFAFPDTALNRMGSTGVMTPGGRAAFYAADESNPALTRLWYFDGGATHEVAHAGETIDGGQFTINGLWYANVQPTSTTVGSESGPAVNDNGVVAFEAVLADADGFYRAILTWKAGNVEPTIVAREEGQIDLDGRTCNVTWIEGFANNGYGYDGSTLKSPLSPDNYLAIGLGYTDSLTGAEGSAVVLVPEPTCLVILAMPLGLALRRRRRL